MELDFSDDDLRALCEDEKLAQRKLGKACSRKLWARLADLEAAAHVRELPAGRPHELKGDRRGQVALVLSGGVRLVIEPNHNPIPKLADGGIDWSSVTKVRIIFIGDYHD